MAWFSIELCMVYLVYAGFAQKTDRRAAFAAAVVGGESLIFAANGFRCPLTDVAESLVTTMVRSPTSSCRVGSPIICPRSTCR